MKISFLFFIALFSLTKLYAQDACETINISFANSPFKAGKPSISNMKKMFGARFSTKKDPVKNQFSDVMDTVVTLTSVKDQFIFYKGQHSSFLYQATIEGNSTVFAGNFSVGDSREKVNAALKLDTRNSCDVVAISNESQFSNHQLIFKNNRLVKVVLDFGMN